MKSEAAARRDWGESIALLVGLALYLGLPNRYTIGGPVLTLALGVVLTLTCALSILWTLVGAQKWTRRLMTVAAGAFALSVATSMIKVVYLVVYRAHDISGTRLLETALAIWVGNVIVFAIAYHWIGEEEFVFPRTAGPGKPLVFLDYVFLSFTTSTAFSPTDTPPLTTRARMYMMLEAAVSLATIAIAAARAVNILT
ncbi:MAG: hypothetical protein WB681_01735 [Candidatus Cybelea sp.]